MTVQRIGMSRVAFRASITAFRTHVSTAPPPAAALLADATCPTVRELKLKFTQLEALVSGAADCCQNLDKVSFTASKDDVASCPHELDILLVVEV